MGKETIKTKKDVTLLSNKLGKFERLNIEELKVLGNHVVRGLAPVTVNKKWGKTVLEVEQRGWIPLTAYFNAGMDGETVLAFIWNSLQVIYESERYGLRLDSFCWDPDKVFVDQYGNLFMVYWPVISLEQSALTVLTFYQGFCGILADSHLPQVIKHQYISYFYQRSYMDLPLFYDLIRDIMAQWKQEKCRRHRDDQASSSAGPDKIYRMVCNGWLERPNEDIRIPLERKETIFGRDRSKCDVEISGFDGVSRSHAVIINKEGQYYLTDLNSKNGTYVQGIRQKPGVGILLQDGDTVRFGNANYVFRQRDADATISIYDMNRR